MDESNYSIFNSQLSRVIQEYSNFKIKTAGGKNFLKGILDIKDEGNDIVGNFAIEIKYSDGFPFRFPKLFEVGGEIPDEADWHKYKDGSCCITVLPDEIIKCKGGITVLGFIKTYAIPYFANYLYKKATENYKNGEYLHAGIGFLQFYVELFKSTDFKSWTNIMDIAFGRRNICIKGKNKCFCGSGVSYKRCHQKIIHKIQILGEKQILSDFKYMLK